MAFCSSTARVGRDIDASPERVSECLNEFVSRHLADRHVDKRATDSFSCRWECEEPIEIDSLPPLKLHRIFAGHKGLDTKMLTKDVNPGPL
eukprot:symbB.v1.2.023274.t1/scaffold2119.1/size88723/6